MSSSSTSSPPPGSKENPSSSGPRISPRIQAMKEAKRAAMAKRDQINSSDDVLIVKDPFQNAHDAKDMVRGQTGFVYSNEMLKHENVWDPEHIECPERLRRSYERCQELGLVELCQSLPARKADNAEILMVHSQKHIDTLEDLVKMKEEEREKICYENYQALYVNEHSLEAARYATGSVLNLTNAVLEGKVQNGMALVRPPGHHAMTEEFCGFCLFNSVAIAARAALQTVKRVLIIDFDVHHGQATQQEFYGSSEVLYVSLHRFENGEFWPNLRESEYDFVGHQDGAGYNVNIPLNVTGMEDKDYLAAFHQIILPLAYEFSPELVLVSAGFDSALGCPEGEMRLSPMLYGHILTNLMGLANGKVAVVLEGGYFIESLAESAAITLRALLGKPSFTLGPLMSPNDSMTDSILNCLSALRRHWNFLQLQEEFSISTYDASTQKNCHEPMILFKGEPDAKRRYIKMQLQDPKSSYASHTEEKKKALLDKLTKIKLRYLSILQNAPLHKVALAYDESMARHVNIEEPNHPEAPERITMMMRKIDEYLLTERMLKIDSRRATEEEICSVHDQQYFETMSKTAEQPQSELNELADKFDSIFMTPDSFDCALLSCGSLLNVIDCVCNGDSEKGVAVIRPPGHHAEQDEACGFCIFNNVAVAAKYAIQSHGLKRVLILDWDVHHGNGIQNMFYNDPNVLYISLHRFDNGTFFPGRKEANYDFTGAGAGKGFNVNIPWNGSGMGDAEYIAALFHIVLPIAYQYDPELVLVSAGFDAARGDPIGKCNVSPETFGHILQHLQNLANGKVVVALEGGYNLNTISLCMAMCIKTLLGDPLPALQMEKSIKPSAVQTLRNVALAQSQFWTCFRFNKALPDSFTDLFAKEAEAVTARQLKEQEEEDIFEEERRYVPKEFGSSGNSCLVNTISLSSHKRDDGVLVNALEKKNNESLAKVMAELKLNPTTVSSSRSDYIPFEYGPTFSSACVNTISSSSSRPRCELKNSLGYTIMETDEKKKRDEESLNK